MKRRVLIVSKFLYSRGGAENVALATADLLSHRGIDTAEWGMADIRNRSGALRQTYASSVAFDGTIRQKLHGFLRTMGYDGIGESFREVLKSYKPQIVHFHNIHSYLSPEIVKIAKEAGCRTIWTLHDYKLVCPAYTLMRNGKPCMDCLDNPKSVVSNRCMKSSLTASVAAYLESRKWNLKKISEWTDIFISPSQFMAKIMTDAGIEKKKLKVVNNFIDSPKIVKVPAIQADYYGYFGRLTPEKGVEYLLEGAIQLPYKLKIFGGGRLEPYLREKYGRHSNIEFMGECDRQTVAEAMSGARLTVIPSLWYENNPLSVLESLCLGVPVAGSRIGGIPELIDEGVNGLLFEPGDTEGLKKAITRLFNTTTLDRATIQGNAQKRFNRERYFEQLSRIYWI